MAWLVRNADASKARDAVTARFHHLLRRARPDEPVWSVYRYINIRALDYGYLARFDRSRLLYGRQSQYFGKHKLNPFDHATLTIPQNIEW